jgi:hypothetical protein
MEDMWDINKVLEIQGNTYNKVEVKTNSESRSLTSSPTWSTIPPCFKLMYMMCPTSNLGDLHMHANLRR